VGAETGSVDGGIVTEEERGVAESILSQLQSDVAALAVPGGRPVGSAGHRRARGYLLERLLSLGLQPALGEAFELPYHGRSPAGRGVAFTNLVGRLPGRMPGLAPLLLVAHYDTCGPTPGADDNAAAVAILLSVVEPLRRAGLERDVWFAFPDAEEPPYCPGPDVGSTWLYTEQRPAAGGRCSAASSSTSSVTTSLWRGAGLHRPAPAVPRG